MAEVSVCSGVDCFVAEDAENRESEKKEAPVAHEPTARV